MSAPPHWSVTTHKGGVGKTSVVTAIAGAAAELGLRVLVVDMDPQANATRRLAVWGPSGGPDDRSRASLAGVLTRPAVGAAQAILRPCGWPEPYASRIDVAPAHLDLELLAGSAAQANSSRRLLTALAGVVNAYDLVLIDTPPSLLSHLIDNAWTAADVVFVPTGGEYDDIEAARRVAERVIRDRDTLNPDLAVGGFLITRYRSSLSLHEQRAGEVESILGPGAVCPFRIPELVAFKNSTERAMPLNLLEYQGRQMALLAQQIFVWMQGRSQAILNGVR